MIRSSLYHLATTNPPSQLLLAIAKPAAVVLSGAISSGRRPFSMKPKRDEAFRNTEDSLDESDARGKEQQPTDQVTQPTASSRLATNLAAEQAWRRHGQLQRHFYAGFDDFFASDPFAPFFTHRMLFNDPFFTSPFPRLEPVLGHDFIKSNTTPTISMNLLRSSPGYEIKESNSTYQIDITIPDSVQASDVKVELEQAGTVIHVSGERHVEQGDDSNKMLHTTRFDKYFTIGPNIDTDRLSANLSQGVLVVKAPKRITTNEQNSKQTIVITNKPHDEISDQQVLDSNYSDAFDESDWAETGKEAIPKQQTAKGL